jgi:tetratricopeptide (TPR) repeat protein
MDKKKGVEQLFDIPIFNPETKGKLEDLYEKNKKTIVYFLSFVAIALIGYFGYKGLIIKPKEKEAQGLIFMAENYFQSDSFQKALSGHPPSIYGFLDIIDEFGQTPTGNLAKYYAGLCYLHLGKYEDAVTYLKKFRTNSELVKPLSLGALGDAYSQLKEYDEAIKYYLRAAHCRKNTFTSPFFYMKAAQTYEFIKEYDKALKLYQKIKKDYSKSQQAGSIDKYIGRINALQGNQ